MREEMTNTMGNEQEKKNKKKRALIILLALLLLLFGAGVPMYMSSMNKEMPNQAATVTLEDEMVPLAGSIEEATKEEDKKPAAKKAAATAETVETAGAAAASAANANGVLGARRIVTDPVLLTAEADAIGEFIATLPTAEEIAAPTTAGSTGTDTSAEDEAARQAAEEAARQAQAAADAAARKAAQVQALKDKIDALKKDLANVKSDSKTAATLAAELEGATEEYTTAVNAANKALNDAKTAAVAAAQASGAGMEALQTALADKNSAAYKYFAQFGNLEKPESTNQKHSLDSTGKNYALGDNVANNEGVNKEVVEAVEASTKVGDEAKETMAENLPTSTNDSNAADPSMAYKVFQWDSNVADANGNYVKYSIMFSPAYDAAPIGGQVPVYFVNAEGQLFVGTVEKKGDNTATVGGMLSDGATTSYFAKNGTELALPTGVSAADYLQGLTAENYADAANALIPADTAAVNAAAATVEGVVNTELDAAYQELAALEGKTVEEVKAETAAPTAAPVQAVAAPEAQAAPVAETPAAPAAETPAPAVEAPAVTE